jgi:hypothetical protein
MNCTKGNNMPEVWVVIIGIVVLLIAYGIVSSKLKIRQQRKAREKSLPFVDDNVQRNLPYNVFLSDGRKFLNVKLIGTSDSSSGQFAIGGWEGMLVLMQPNGKRVFVRQSSVRCIEEA